MAKSPQSYGDALAERNAALNQARLADPDEHFPYKLDAALDAAAHDTAPAKVHTAQGPREAATEEFLPRSVAEASAKYIDAQETYLRDPSPANHEAYENARDRLVWTRRAERVGRVNHGIAADEVSF